MKKFILLACALGILCACHGHDHQPDEQHADTPAVAESTVSFGYLPTVEHNKSYQRGLSIALTEANNKKLSLGGQRAHFVWQTASHSQMQSLTHTLNTTKWRAILGQIGPKTTTISQTIALPSMSLAMDGEAAKTSDKAAATVFHVWPTLSQQGKLIAQYLREQNIQKIAIVNRGRPSGLAKALAAQLQMGGQRISIYALQHFSQKELRQLMAQLAADKPDLVFYSGDALSAAQLVKRLQQNQLLIPLMMTAGACEASFIRQAGQFAPGSMAVVAGLSLPEMKSASGFTALYQQQYHQQPDAAAAYAYDAAWAIITAMQQADSADPHVYLPKLRSLNLRSGLLSGPLTFNQHGVRNEVAMTVYQVEEDKWVVADTIRGSLNQTGAATH